MPRQFCFSVSSRIVATLLSSLLWLSLPAGAATASADDLAGLQSLVQQQQAVIQQLLENQRRQGQQIEELRQQLSDHSQLIGSVEDSAVDESYSISPEKEPEIGVEEVLAAATPIRVLPGEARFSVGGHINRAVNIADDGEDVETFHVDSGSVPTLAYLKAYLPVNEQLTFGGHIETALQNNSASVVSQDNRAPGFTHSARNFELTLDHERYGKLWFGRGLMSSFIAVELDKSETWRYNIISPGNTAGGLKFTDRQTEELSDITVGLVFIDAEAFNRKDRVRYDSPVFGGLRISGSVGTADSNDVTLRWNGKLGGVDITAATSLQNNPVLGRVSDRVDGGVAFYHGGTGLSLSLVGAKQDYKRSFYQNYGRTDGDNEGYGVRLGLRRNWFELGETRMGLDYFDAEDVLYKKDSAESTGFFISQNIDAWSVEPYFGYRFYDYDTGPQAGGLSLDKVQVWTFGARMALDLTVQ